MSDKDSGKAKKKGFLGEFKKFIMRGNVLDMAVGVVIAAAFGKITNSLVNDIIMPAVGVLIGGTDLSQLNIMISQAVMNGDEIVTPAVVIGIGSFLSAIIDFILIALVIFVVMKVINGFHFKLEAKKKAEEAAAKEAPADGPTTEQLLTEILEELKKR